MTLHLSRTSLDELLDELQGSLAGKDPASVDMAMFADVAAVIRDGAGPQDGEYARLRLHEMLAAAGIRAEDAVGAMG